MLNSILPEFSISHDFIINILLELLTFLLHFIKFIQRNSDV